MRALAVAAALLLAGCTASAPAAPQYAGPCDPLALVHDALGALGQSGRGWSLERLDGTYGSAWRDLRPGVRVVVTVTCDTPREGVSYPGTADTTTEEDRVTERNGKLAASRERRILSEKAAAKRKKGEKLTKLEEEAAAKSALFGSIQRKTYTRGRDYQGKHRKPKGGK